MIPRRMKGRNWGIKIGKREGTGVRGLRGNVPGLRYILGIWRWNVPWNVPGG
jgi:hypothetical protein